MRSWSIPAGRLFGADVRIHLTFVFLLLFVWITESALPGSAGMGRGLALIGLIFASVVLHEMGHAMAGVHDGGSRALILMPIGGISLADHATPRLDPRRELRIALAGPAVNLTLAAIGGCTIAALLPEAHLLQRPFVFSGNLPRSFFWINVFLGVFNLLPAYPADGGRMVRALLSRRMDVVRATRRAVTLGQAFAMLFILGGMFNVWFTLVGFFLFVAAQLEERAVIFQSVLDHVKLEEIMLTDFCTLSPADTLEAALHKSVHTLQDDFPVVRGGDMVGVISRQAILDALRSEGNGYVQSAMNRTFAVAPRGEKLATAFRVLTRRRMGVVPVVDEGRLVGIVSLQNLMHSMALLVETKKVKQRQQQQQ
ncbi:MAG TPA: site-2 protease family protein [Terriglobales bacterium]|nr:site-2 protease family protein [Terriglobales bacterium]